MIGPARIAAAIEILDRVQEGEPAEKALTNWARGSRFAGSSDRAAIRDHVFDALRNKLSFARLGGAMTGRGLMLGALRAAGQDPRAVFTGEGHAPAPLTDTEKAPPGPMDLHTVLDCPYWLAEELSDSLGEDFAPVMRALKSRAPVFLRVNLLKTNREGARAALAAEAIETRPHPLASTALEVTANPRRIKNSQAYRDGLVELQDAAAQAICEAMWLPGKPPRQRRNATDQAAAGAFPAGETGAGSGRAPAAGATEPPARMPEKATTKSPAEPTNQAPAAATAKTRTAATAKTQTAATAKTQTAATAKAPAAATSEASAPKASTSPASGAPTEAAANEPSGMRDPDPKNATPQPARVLDFCAGGGGKSLALAARGAQVDAHDVSPARLKDLPARARRAGADIPILTRAQVQKGAPYPQIIADVPCSGSGAWRRQPEGKWRLSPEVLDQLCAIQARILDEIVDLAALGGSLTYITCSLLKRENEDQIAAFLERHPGWHLTDQRRYLPRDGGDGFYVARLQSE